MNKQILKNIKASLYDLGSSLEIVREKFIKNSIDVNKFLNIIKVYRDSFDILEREEDEVLLQQIDEKLRFIVNHYISVDLYPIQIKTSIHFLEKEGSHLFNITFGKTENFYLKMDVEEQKNIYLDAIKIKNYFSIKDIKITNLKDKKEIYFVGGNGEGKTILLQAIILGLKKMYSGQIIEYIRNEKDKKFFIKDELSNEYSDNKNIQNVFAYGINRNKVREKFDEYGYSGLFDTSDFKDTTFLKNPLDLLQNDSTLVQEFIEKLNNHILINDLKVKKNESGKVSFIEKHNEKEFKIDFGTLSEGYKSTVIWICDLTARLIENQKDITTLAEFKAIVLVDEVDLYLHPKWKYDFVYNLRKVFPKIQFIMITHSTATILGASKDAVFYKIYKENGETKVSQPISSIKNLMANNLSTSPLFDMTTARARNSNEELKTDEDFIYTKIHEIVSEQVKGKKAIIEDEIVELINKELDDYIKEQGL